jgi:hypothetical protein
MANKKPSARKAPERATKPTLPREEPIRSWSTLFGQAPPPGMNGSGGPAGFSGVASDSVRRGVELGYRVVDEYLKQGASVASAFSNPAASRGLGAQDLPKLTARMMQYMSDFTSLWFDAMNVVSDNANAQSRAGAEVPPFPVNGSSNHRPSPRQDGASPAPGRSRYVFQVSASGPAEVIIALDEPVTGALRVEPLKTQGGRGKIEGVVIEPPTAPSGPLRAHVTVPPGLKPGRYSGAIVDAETQQPRGRVTVTVGG